MGTARILLVDREQKTRSRLRSFLEDSQIACELMDVSSGEDALLELARSRIDLLVTSIDLHGMSGIELIEWVMQLNTRIRSIALANPLEDDRTQLMEALGVVSTLYHPVEEHPFIDAVERALTSSKDGKMQFENIDTLLDHLRRRVGRIRLVLEAQTAFIISRSGEIVASDGEAEDVHVHDLLPALRYSLTGGMQVSELLEADAPRSCQFFDGGNYDCYLANIGDEYGLAVLFKGRQKEGRMEAVTHYSRRVAHELLPLLDRLDEGMDDSGVIFRLRMVSQDQLERMQSDLEDAVKITNGQDAEGFWEEATLGDGPAREGNGLTFEQASDQGLLEPQPVTSTDGD